MINTDYNIGRYYRLRTKKLRQKTIPSDFIAYFYMITDLFFLPSYPSVGKEKKKKVLQIQRPILDLYLWFYTHKELNCALSHSSINQNESTGFKGPPPDLFLCDWQQDVLSFLPLIAVVLLVIAIKWDHISLHSSLYLAFLLMISLLIKEINIYFHAIHSFGTMAKHIISHTQFHLKQIQTHTVSWILATASTGRSQIIFSLDLCH